MNLYLIRHTSVDIPAGYAYGQTDVPLKDSFETEASIVKEKLKGEHFDRIWTSPLSRCVHLARYCGYPDAIQDERIKELNFGRWEMKTWEEIAEDPLSKEWFKDWLNFPPPGGESFMDQYRRVSSFLDEIKENGYNNVCVFAHGGVLACAQIYAESLDPKEAFAHIVPYGEVLKLHY